MPIYRISTELKYQIARTVYLLDREDSADLSELYVVDLERQQVLNFFEFQFLRKHTANPPKKIFYLHDFFDDQADWIDFNTKLHWDIYLDKIPSWKDIVAAYQAQVGSFTEISEVIAWAEAANTAWANQIKRVKGLHNLNKIEFIKEFLLDEIEVID